MSKEIGSDLTVISGRAVVLGKNIDTDQIYPGRYLDLIEPEDLAKHCLEGVNPEIPGKWIKGDIVVASTNFGCGSSREHAPRALKAMGVSVVIAESFARIFFRNAINLKLPLISCEKISEKVVTGDELEVNPETGEIKNLTQGTGFMGESYVGII